LDDLKQEVSNKQPTRKRAEDLSSRKDFEITQEEEKRQGIRQLFRMTLASEPSGGKKSTKSDRLRVKQLSIAV
jgi:hypothetical protein